MKTIMNGVLFMNLAHEYAKEIDYAIAALQLCLEDSMKHYPKSDVNVKILKEKIICFN